MPPPARLESECYAGQLLRIVQILQQMRKFSDANGFDTSLPQKIFMP